MGTCVNKGEVLLSPYNPNPNSNPNPNPNPNPHPNPGLTQALLSPHSEENSTKPAVLGTCPLQTLGVEGVGHH